MTLWNVWRKIVHNNNTIAAYLSLSAAYWAHNVCRIYATSSVQTMYSYSFYDTQYVLYFCLSFHCCVHLVISLQITARSLSPSFHPKTFSQLSKFVCIWPISLGETSPCLNYSQTHTHSHIPTNTIKRVVLLFLPVTVRVVEFCFSHCCEIFILLLVFSFHLTVAVAAHFSFSICEKK